MLVLAHRESRQKEIASLVNVIKRIDCNPGQSSELENTDPLLMVSGNTEAMQNVADKREKEALLHSRFGTGRRLKRNVAEEKRRTDKQVERDKDLEMLKTRSRQFRTEPRCSSRRGALCRFRSRCYSPNVVSEGKVEGLKKDSRVHKEKTRES